MPSKKKKSKEKLSLKDLATLKAEDNSESDKSTIDTQETEVLDAILNPLQVLISEPFRIDSKGKELADTVLLKTAEAERETCRQLYAQLCARIDLLADEVITVSFPWRLRVGGIRGFRDLLLPVFHPVYGIPYVPSSGVKGLVKVWAKRSGKLNINRLLGYLEGADAALGAVQILDAFPTKPCLKLDIANPQWSWMGNRVKYGTVPHSLLSMVNVNLKIGIARTSLGNLEDVKQVKSWIEEALLSEGLGSRVSAGYGRASKVNQRTQSSKTQDTQGYVSEHPFEFWSQGIYGADMSTPEFRPVAVRGVLRYWFRAIALGLYTANECQSLESELFGAIDPQPREGSLKITAYLQDEDLGSQTSPHYAEGTLLLEAHRKVHLELINHLLKLAFHIGGVGRGARRPLHWNSGRLRGCYWQSGNAPDRLPADAQAWKKFLSELIDIFTRIRPASDRVPTLPGRPQDRYQDVFNDQARIFLVPSPKLKLPSQVKAWETDGDRRNVRGAGLEFLYGRGYKGGSPKKQGNPNVGGDLGTPSFVWIQSNCLNDPKAAYQAVTIFDIAHPDRERFAQELSSDAKNKLVWPLTL